MPLGWAVVALVAYVAGVLAGVLVLRLRVFVDAVVEGPRGVRGIVLTFDDGPDVRSTPRVLDILERAGVSATFFVIGKKAEVHPELVRDMVRRGHTVGLHSYAHDRLFALRSEGWVRDDLERGMGTLEAILGERPRLFRPPIGHTNPRIARVIQGLGLVVIGWTVSGGDGVRTDPERVAARVRGRLRDGAIVLLHDAAERGDYEPAGPRALAEVLEASEARGIEVVALETWLDMLSPPSLPATPS
ncbi:MAG: polysaccharide deacetylase family protein [Myxococcales bacterium]